MSLHGTIKMTARQFSQLGEDPPGASLELVAGEVTVSPGPQPQHSRVEKRLSHILPTHMIANDLGEPGGEGRDKDVVHFPPFPDLAISLGELWLPSRP